MTKGLRFNAKKEKEGKYFTTQIWSFHMKCFSTSCVQRFKILTDPKNCTYDFAEGIRKHEQDFTPDADDSLLVATSDETKQLIANDPMFRLQHNEEDRKRVLSAKEHLEALTELQEEHHKNYYDVNSMLRSKNRKRKKRDIELLGEAHSKGLSMPLLEPSAEDSEQAKMVVFKRRAIANVFALNEKQRLNNIQSQSIFERPATTTSSTSHPTKKSSSSSSSRSNGRALVVRPTTVPTAAAVPPSKYAQTAALLAKASALRIDAKNLRMSDPVAARQPSSSSTAMASRKSDVARSDGAGFGDKRIPCAGPSVVTHKKVDVDGGAAGSSSISASGGSLLGMLNDYDD